MVYKISVIIPVYNIKDYLDRCMLSVVNQTYKNLEIILVDDGSTDGSSELCENWAQKDGRVRVIHKKNGGLGKARNTGIERATGDYISFVDGDDWIQSNMYDKLVDCLVDNQYEIISFGYYKATDTDVLFEKKSHIREGEYNGEIIKNKILPYMLAPSDPFDFSKILIKSACTCIYKRTMLNGYNIRFKSEREIFYEDFCFNVECLSNITSIYYINKSYYYYYTRNDSLTGYYIPNQITLYENLYRELYKILVYTDNMRNAKQNLEIFWLIASNNSIWNLCQKNVDKSKQQIIENIRVILQNKRLKNVVNDINSKGWNFKSKIILLMFKMANSYIFYYVFKGRV